MKKDGCKHPGFVLLMLLLFAHPLTAAQNGGPDQEAIDKAIRRGKEYLIRMQRIDGTWNNKSPGNNVGQTALCALALCKAGLEPDHPAIQKALNLIDNRSPTRTYDLSVILALLGVVGVEGREHQLEHYGSMLLDTQMGRLWAYPTNVVDMSNTQYAALGLNAAANCGLKTGWNVWEDLIKGVTNFQADDGGWGYRRNSKSTGSMTCAGLTCLYVGQRQLEAKGKKRALSGSAHTALEQGLAWMDEYFRVDRNPRPHESKKKYRWTYYYLYGVERVGSLSGRDHFKEKDWYREGAEWLLKKQGKKGQWSSDYGESELNTAFALLFLSRATLGAYTKVNRQSLLLSKGEGEDGKQDIVIACNRKNPGFLWIESWSDEVAKRFGIDGGEKKIRVRKADYYCDGELLGSVTEDTSGGVVTRFALPYEFDENGNHRIHAEVECISKHGSRTETFKSGKFELFVHNVLTDRDRQYMEDLERNLMEKGNTHVTTSSRWDGNWKGSRAVDGLQGTGWLSAKESKDEAPWIKLDFEEPIRANCLKISHTMRHHFDKNRYGRATLVRVVINRGSQKFEAALGPEENVKYEVPFKTARIREIRIEMLERVKGHKHVAAGFAEIELFYMPSK